MLLKLAFEGCTGVCQSKEEDPSRYVDGKYKRWEEAKRMGSSSLLPEEQEKKTGAGLQGVWGPVGKGLEARRG